MIKQEIHRPISISKSPVSRILMKKYIFLWILVIAFGPGCGAEIGDSCSTNLDCSPMGERICDTAQVEGYCTIEGCDLTTCPEEAECIRFFPTANHIQKMEFLCK